MDSPEREIPDMVPDISQQVALQPEASMTTPELKYFRRYQVAEGLGLPLREALGHINDLTMTQPDLFKIDDETGALLCSEEIFSVIGNRQPSDPALPSLESTGQSGLVVNVVKIADHVERTRVDRAKKDFAAFKAEVSSGETIDAKAFENLVHLLGAENGMDVLYRFRPEYKGRVPIAEIRGFLAEYLGEFMVAKNKLDFDRLGEALPYLTDTKLQEALGNVLKRSCITDYNQSVRKNPDEDDFDVIAEYLHQVKKKVESFENDDLMNVIANVSDYYQEVFAIEKPRGMVDSLVGGRPFPDLNQRVNVYETIRNTHVLIADAYGMGKSASAIVSKEVIGAKCAIITMPSAVLERGSWQTYLSSKMGKNGQHIGYFKEGHEPKVLIVQSKNDLQDISADDYDYILISQERLDEEYTQLLGNIGADMLIVDEAHKLKNITDGKRSQQVIELERYIRDRDGTFVMLTATPAPNKVRDIALTFKTVFSDKFADVDNADLIASILNGDILELRGLLLERMQMKRQEYGDSLVPPDEQTVWIELSDQEKQIYEILLEEWELTANDKLRYLRQILLNSEILDGTPAISPTKLLKINEDLINTFATKNKVLMFVNDYVNGIITGDKTILDKLEIPEDVTVRIIYGDTPKALRQKYSELFQESDEKTLLIVSGQTVSVGVDYSAADAVFFLNGPWTYPDEAQQKGRAQRFGRSGQLAIRKYITAGTIEEGMEAYVHAKNRAIEKLFFGVPITEIEQTMVINSELQDIKGLEVNPELARYYISAIDRMNQIFGRVKEIGEQRFMQFLEKHGEEYALTYKKLTSRSFQANSSRLSGTIISRLENQRAETADATQPVIVDVGSGPEMLRRHISDDLKNQVLSIDLNSNQLLEAEGRYAVAPMSNIPVPDKHADYINLSLAFHYTAWRPSYGEYERLQVLGEVNRALKVGGRAIITLPHSLNLRDISSFAQTVEKVGFRIDHQLSGIASSGEHFETQLVTLKKYADCPAQLGDLIETVGIIAKEGLRFAAHKRSLKDTRRIATGYNLDNGTRLETVLNRDGLDVLHEEQTVMSEMIALRRQTETNRIQDIPSEEIISRGFARIHNSKRYLLYKQLVSGDGAVIVYDNS